MSGRPEDRRISTPEPPRDGNAQTEFHVSPEPDRRTHGLFDHPAEPVPKIRCCIRSASQGKPPFMTTATTNGASSGTTEPARSSANAFTTRVRGLDELLGGHPEALRAIYLAGRPTDPAELGDEPRGLLLAMEPTREIHFLVRPILTALTGGVMPWKGKRFDGAGTGRNVVFGRQIVPFGYDLGPSDLDGQPTLVIRYDRSEDRNPWPVRNIRDELRTIADGVAIGPALFSPSERGARKVVLWFGLERPR